jgi:hypothetical protein
LVHRARADRGSNNVDFFNEESKVFFFEKVKNDPEWAPPWLDEHAGTGQKNVLLQPTRLMGYFGAVR